MPSPRTIPSLAGVLGLAIVTACTDRETEPPAKVESEQSSDSDGPGANVEERVKAAAEGVRRTGERVEVGAKKAADAIERAGERAHERIDRDEVERAEAKQMFLTWAKQELKRIDDALKLLEAKGDAAGKQAYADLRATRDRLQARVDELAKQTGEAWRSARQEIERDLEKLRADIEARRST